MSKTVEPLSSFCYLIIIKLENDFKAKEKNKKVFFQKMFSNVTFLKLPKSNKINVKINNKMTIKITSNLSMTIQ